MEVLYKKDKDGKFVEAGYSGIDISDGIWLVQSPSHGRSMTSLIWKIGDIPKADVKIHATLQKFSDKLARLLMKLTEEDSEEYKEAKVIEGGYLSGPIKIYNWSMGSLSNIILRELSKWTQEELENEK